MQCDRTKPCSACCARGHPKECEFVVGEGNDYSPIQQSYEIRKLRLENQQLKERLQAIRQGHPDDDGAEDDVALDQRPSRSGTKPVTARQRSLRTIDRVDNIYFGTPGLASIVSDVAYLPQSAALSIANHTTVRQPAAGCTLVDAHRSQGSRSVCSRLFAIPLPRHLQPLHQLCSIGTSASQRRTSRIP